MKSLGLSAIFFIFFFCLFSCRSVPNQEGGNDASSDFVLLQDYNAGDKATLSPEPFIRINPPMHTDRITNITVDRESKIALTASNDRTGRLWRIEDGALLKVFRLPITENVKEYSGGLSPDGRSAVFGAAVPRGIEAKSFSLLFVFDVKTGLLDRTVDAGGGVIETLAFSPDGKFLAAGYREKNGVKIYATSGWNIAASLQGFSDRVSGCAFSEDGRLAVTSDDGKITLFDRSFKPLKEAALNGGKLATALEFSPDGKQTAVGFFDSGRVQVLASDSLNVVREMDTSRKHLGFALAWSRDGKNLTAGGGNRAAGPDGRTSSYIRVWRQSGYTDFSASKNAVFALKTLPDGSVLWAGNGPDWGRLDPSGKSVFNVAADFNDLKIADKSLFGISDDGLSINFSTVSGIPYTFSLSAMELGKIKGAYKSPAARNAGTVVTDWNGKTAVKINGKTLPMRYAEEARCVDVSSQGNSVVLGTQVSLFLLSRDNKDTAWKVRKSPVPPVWAVNIAAKAPVFAAMIHDGTIRWYRLIDGKEILSLFVHPDGKRWVVWTPSGYYAASPGGDSLIGWHVNNGPDKAADFFGADRFASRFCRPDIVALTQKYFDEGKAIVEANEARNVKIASTVKEMLPPVVTILDPQEGSRVKEKNLQVTLSIRSAENAKVNEIKIFVDGRPAEAMKNVTIQSTDKNGRTVTVGLSEREAGMQKITVQARNDYGWSEPVSINVLFESPDKIVFKPKLYVLAVGVSDYQHVKPKLNFAAKDARDFVGTWPKQTGKLYQDVEIKTLTDEKAGKEEILDGLDWIQRKTGPNDVAMLYLSGHGLNDSNGIYYYLPSNTDLEKLRRTGIPFYEITNTLSSIKGKVLLFLDTCHAGNILGQKKNLAEINAVVNELSRCENGIIVFASSTGNQVSLESPDWGNGAFTKAVLEGLSGKADYSRKGKITVNSLDLYVSDRVQELTAGKQTPATAKPQTIPDFPVSMY